MDKTVRCETCTKEVDKEKAWTLCGRDYENKTYFCSDKCRTMFPFREKSEHIKAKLFDFVRITDKTHKHFGKTGQLTDFDTIDVEYVLHFDKLSKGGNVYWISDSTRVNKEQVERISKLELERI